MDKLILIVDDSPHVAANLEIAIGAMGGVETVVARNGEEALRFLESRTPSAVVTDLEMPRMDGYELIRRLRGDRRWRHLPVIVVSASGEDQARQRSLDAGARVFFRKPYSPAALRQSLEQILNETTPVEQE